MTRPYSLFKKFNGYYYVQFLLADGSRSQNKSTGTKDRKEAESIAMRWAVLGDIPERINSKAEKAKSQSVDRISFFNSMSTYDFSPEEIDKMISIMQKRGFILSAVKPNSKQSIPIEDFLDEFWNYEKSPYVQELALEGKNLSRSHVKNERSRVENYWIPKLKGKCIGFITNDMLKDIVSDKKIQKLAGKTINGIVESITTPLKWAMKNQYIENITFYGLKRRNTKSEERAILTMEEADKVMNIGWENDKAKLANKLAMQTGMRASQIRGLRICDIHAEGIIVDHAGTVTQGLINVVRMEKHDKFLFQFQKNLEKNSCSSENLIHSAKQIKLIFSAAINAILLWIILAGLNIYAVRSKRLDMKIQMILDSIHGATFSVPECWTLSLISELLWH